MLLSFMQDIVSDTTLFELVKALGPSGGLTAIFVYLFMQLKKENKEERTACDKRINALAERLEKSNVMNIDSQKETTKEYAELVKSTTRVTADLTMVVKSINTTLERMERKAEGR